jgi:hypothetical protein
MSFLGNIILTDHQYILNQITYKGKPAERQGRKALGLKQDHGRPAAMYNLLLSWQLFYLPRVEFETEGGGKTPKERRTERQEIST